MPWGGKERWGIVEFDDTAQVHHGNLRGDVLDDSQIVTDEHVGQVEFALQVHQQIQDLGLYRHIERRGGLVAHDHLWVHHQCTGDRNALALPPRKLPRGVAGQPLRQPHAREHLDCAVTPLCRRPDPVNHKRKLHNGLNRPSRIQRRIRVLKHRLNAARPLASIHALERDPVNSHGPVRGRHQAEQHARQRRFSAPGFANDAKHITALDGKVNAVDRVQQPFGLEHARAHLEGACQAHGLDQRAHDAISPGSSTQRQRCACPSLRTGIAEPQDGLANSHRSRNAHP